MDAAINMLNCIGVYKDTTMNLTNEVYLWTNIILYNAVLAGTSMRLYNGVLHATNMGIVNEKENWLSQFSFFYYPNKN